MIRSIFLTIALLLAQNFLRAAVQSVIVTERSVVLNGQSFGKAGAYEKLEGTVHFAVDPKAAANRSIADIDLAPRNAKNQVEFSANFYILQPRDASGSNSTALMEISNRGGKGLLSTFNFAHGSSHPQTVEEFGDGFLLNQGFTLVWIGWEFDVPASDHLLKLDAPIATDHGKTITGLVRSEWTGDEKVNTISLGDRTQTGYPAADPHDPANAIYVRDQIDGARTLLPRSAWNFADATHVTMSAGFEPGRIYEVVYRAKNPAVAGLGFAAIRDFVSFLKRGDTRTALGDEHGRARNTLGFGISQDGRYLRALLYQGFNTDEVGKPVFDGVWAHVGGAGRGSFNERFAQPSRDGHPFLNVFYPVDVPPFRAEALLEKEKTANTVPKLFLSNGSYEYWGRCASLIHTTEDGLRDAPPIAGTRIYFFAGSQHTPGRIPPAATATQNPADVVDYRAGMRALLIAMQNWITKSTEPPPSQIPTIEAGQLVTLKNYHFPVLPGVIVPMHMREAYRLDFTKEPPAAGPPYPALVPQVNEDGNESSGIRMPEVSVPLATYTGWNLRKSSLGAPDELFSMIGSFLPFAKTQEERERLRDPRRSVAERYRNEVDYLQQIDNAAQSLAHSGYLLPEDIPRLKNRAAEEWKLVTETKAVSTQ